jgi:hypothetical protein
MWANSFLKSPTNSADQAALGDGWYDFGEMRVDRDNDGIFQRAAFWYQLSLASKPVLTGLTKARAEQQVKEWEPITTPPTARSVDLLALIDPAKHTLTGTWARIGDHLVSSADEHAAIYVPYQPSSGYELTLKGVLRLVGKDKIISIILVSGDKSVAATFNHRLSSILELVDGQVVNPNLNQERVPFSQGIPFTLKCRVEKRRRRRSMIKRQSNGRARGLRFR